MAITGQKKDNIFDSMEGFTTETPAHADNFNEKWQKLLDNDVTLNDKKMDKSPDGGITTTGSIVTSKLTGTSIAVDAGIDCYLVYDVTNCYDDIYYIDDSFGKMDIEIKNMGGYALRHRYKAPVFIRRGGRVNTGDGDGIRLKGVGIRRYAPDSAYNSDGRIYLYFYFSGAFDPSTVTNSVGQNLQHYHGLNQMEYMDTYSDQALTGFTAPENTMLYEDSYHNTCDKNFELKFIDKEIVNGEMEIAGAFTKAFSINEKNGGEVFCINSIDHKQVSNGIIGKFARYRSNGEGAGIFATKYTGKPQFGKLYVYDTTNNSRFAEYSLFKADENSVVQYQLVINNELSITATNAHGTICMNDISGNIRLYVDVVTFEI